MVWGPKSTMVEISSETKVDVDLSDFEADQLLQALIDNEVITKTEAEQLLDRVDDNPFEIDIRFLIDAGELEEARADLFSGRRAEAFIHLERALGGDFVGRLAVA